MTALKSPRRPRITLKPLLVSVTGLLLSSDVAFTARRKFTLFPFSAPPEFRPLGSRALPEFPPRLLALFLRIASTFSSRTEVLLISFLHTRFADESCGALC
ncbi:MAG TPA: hypothetical protein VJV96_07605, partial [Candidatus Angelobacter sp.]|nr:hypothetical protein [Candidatus Angelobacter sp.]